MISLLQLAFSVKKCYNSAVDFTCWLTLNGLRPDDVFYKNRPDKPGHNAKTVSCDIEQHYFRSTRITGYRIQQVA